MDNKAYEGNEERITPPPSYTDAIQLDPSRLEGLVTDPIGIKLLYAHSIYLEHRYTEVI